VPWLVAVAFFMEALDTTILNTAGPAIAAALVVSPLSMKSVLASYTLSLAIFIPLSGWMADRFGTRTVFASAIGLFTLGSLLCGLSNSVHMLVAFSRRPSCVSSSAQDVEVAARPKVNAHLSEQAPKPLV
jgi:MFS family permease